MSKRGSKSLYDYCIENKYEPLLDEWDNERNGDLTPHNVSYGCKKRVWWRCSKGHSWEDPVGYRVDKYRDSGKGCPVCECRLVVPGLNDLATTHPEIAAQWHPTKNGDLKPTDVPGGSDRRVWWICEKGHYWEASVRSRARLGSGCPYCAKHFIWPDDSLAATHPEIAALWHPTKNGNLTPYDITYASNKKVWWRCDKGHEWMKLVYRCVKDSSCPYCSDKLIDGFNDLATTHPEIAAFWHPTRNKTRTPSKVKADSNARVWWQCDKGHEWMMPVNRFAVDGSCPFCNGRVVVGFNDLATTHPIIAAQWHPTKNGSLTPVDVTADSKVKVWWQCQNGHEREMTVEIMARKRPKCPLCVSKKYNREQERYMRLVDLILAGK